MRFDGWCPREGLGAGRDFRECPCHHGAVRELFCVPRTTQRGFDEGRDAGRRVDECSRLRLQRRIALEWESASRRQSRTGAIAGRHPARSSAAPSTWYAAEHDRAGRDAQGVPILSGKRKGEVLECDGAAGAARQDPARVATATAGELRSEVGIPHERDVLDAIPGAVGSESQRAVVEIEQTLRRDRPAVELEVNQVADGCDFTDRVSRLALGQQQGGEGGERQECREAADGYHTIEYAEACRVLTPWLVIGRSCQNGRLRTSWWNPPMTTCSRNTAHPDSETGRLPFLVRVPSVEVFGALAANTKPSLREATVRTRAFAVIALLALSSGLGAQGGIRLPRGARPTTPQPAPNPPAIGPVSQALAYTRSRWSTEAYSVISTMDVPSVAGRSSRYTTFGAGTHAEYRVSDHVSATVDLTASPLGTIATSQTAEVGARYSPMSWEHRLRPFFDVRAGYMHLHDSFTAPTEAGAISGLNQDFTETGRYSRGLGGISGLGLEYSLTNTFALTSELSAMRNRMTNYELTGPASLPTGSNYWMTSFRYTLGLKFSPVRSLHLSQNPTH